MAGTLRGRVAVVTGVSRRVGIGYAVAARLAAAGAGVLVQSWETHDAAQPWGADPLGAAGVVERLRAELPAGSGEVEHLSADLADPAAPAAVVDAAVARFGGVDIVVAVHARSSMQDLFAVTAAELDASFAVNVRGSVLLARRLAEVRERGRPGGRVVLFTSGQHLGPMPSEIPYIVSKGALQQVTASLAAGLAPHGITVNCVNPGPVDTGYADDEARARVAAAAPFGRWGTPADTADLVEWLVSDAGQWVTGQTLVSDGGFSLRG
ncbi:SDR family oxidoreductase [Actinokineospora sp.]|uniref:SDR family oxidoreductase n=1 Tax=Actinokineospora sp. TaxID=1872133 RepID=UPI004037619C